MENKEKILFTSESVTEGHPDKICDAISDAILDALIAQDPMSRVACETATTTGLVLVMGEITSKANIDIQSIVRETIREIGYTRGKFGFDADTCAVITALDKQSADIAMGVDKALEQKENQMDEDELDSIGAGDQGIQFGYASNETEEYMPYAINMAHKLSRQLTKVRKDGTLFSGKDCTKVDRSAAYAARYVAKNIVAAGLADKCEIQLSYAIGVAHPTSIHVETFGTGKVSDAKLVEIIRENFDLRPAGIIKMLDLRRPIYKQTSAYGHFGRTDVDLPWEHLDKVDDLKKYLA